MSETTDTAFPREVYEELRSVARAYMAGERASHTLQPTALAHEAILKICNRPPGSFPSESDYIAAAAEAMRQILVDHARRRSAAKRGGGAVRMDAAEIDVPEVAPQLDDEGKLCVNDLLNELDATDPDLTTIIKLRVFAGLTTEAVAGLMGCARKTVERRWRYAAALLRTRLQGVPG